MLTITVINLINALLIAMGLGICSLCILQISASVHLSKEVRRYFQVFFSLIIVYIATHLARQLMDGTPGDGIHIALRIVTFTEILTAGFMAFLISVLVLTVSKNEKGFGTIGKILLTLLVSHGILMVVGEFTQLIYYFDQSNVYHRGAGYLLSNLCPVGMLGIDMVLLIRYRKNIDRRVRTAFWIYMIAPVAAVIIQGISYGLQFIIFATVAAAVYMFAVILQIQNEKYEKQQKENSRIETELTMASSIQADMLPNIYPAFPERPEFDIFASMDPAKEVGGDFYDYFLIDDDHLCLVIADVSGKGVPAALFMMASKIILANNAQLGKSPAQILTDTNSAICANNREEMFVTVWLGILELSTGKMTAANAGHEYPVLRHPGGAYELVKDKHGFVVGGMDGLTYKEYELFLEPGARLFVYTDGLPESTSSDHEMFGAERMLKALNSCEGGTPKEVLEQVRNAVNLFVKKAEQFDDLTMLCVEYKGSDRA